MTSGPVGSPVPDGLSSELELRSALGRSLLIAGAAERALAMTVQYCGERTQFGRRIGGLQAVQQQVALLAGEAVAAQAAAEAAVLTCDRLGFGAPETFWAVSSAKARTSEAAGAAAKIAHQVHGALGFTLEHPLRLITTRLWAWRDECGGEAYWQERLGVCGSSSSSTACRARSGRGRWYCLGSAKPAGHLARRGIPASRQGHGRGAALAGTAGPGAVEPGQ
jgi:alkylation response protein AidB-like acyl-CoA dehydrogenase